MGGLLKKRLLRSLVTFSDAQQLVYFMIYKIKDLIAFLESLSLLVIKNPSLTAVNNIWPISSLIEQHRIKNIRTDFLCVMSGDFKNS
jgi:hypothetical protein